MKLSPKSKLSIMCCRVSIICLVFLFKGLTAFSFSGTELFDFTIVENYSNGVKVNILAVDSTDKPRHDVNGVYRFAINGFEQEFTFIDGQAVISNPIESSSFLVVKQLNNEKYKVKLFFIFKFSERIFPVHVNWYYLVLIPGILVLIGFFVRRLMVWAIFLLIALFVFNARKGLTLDKLWDTILNGITNYFD